MGRETAEGAIRLLSAAPVPAGSMPVVVCPAWGGVLVHECFGHSLEGDGIRKKTSIRASQFGQQVAAKGVLIYDDATVPYSRGSFRVDDEGTPSQKTLVVEDGILRGYLWDVLNARLTGNRSTGNGRRASYREYPIPRMTNTYIAPGKTPPADIIASVDKGFYCANFGGGSVNPADGNFSFHVTEGFIIEKGKLGSPGVERDARRQRRRRHAPHRDARRRSRDRHDDRHLRQVRPVQAGGGRTADRQVQRAHGGRPLMSDAKKIARQLADQALRAGAQEAEAYVQNGRQVQVTVNSGHVDFVREAHTRGGGLRVFVDHKLGFVYSSDFRSDAIADLAQRAVTLARYGLADENAGLPGREWLARGEDRGLELYDDAIPALSTEKRIAMALGMEKAALGVDPRIKRTQGCGVTSFAGSFALASSHGADLEYSGTTMSVFVTALAEDAGGKQQGWSEGGTWRHLAELPDAASLGEKAGRKALERLGPRKVESQKVPVVMHPDMVESWLSRVAGAFSGEEVLKKTSYLHDKLGQTIAASKVTLVNDGRRKRGAGSQPFDGEGVPTRRTVLIEAGVCKSFLYDSYNARKARVEPTGSAGRGYASVPSIDTQNLYLEPGDQTLEQLIAGVQRGFYYIDSGAFGYNTTTGDYSFQASGFWIENGAVAYPVDEITVASTTLDMLRNVDAIGKEIEWRGAVSCPALRISEMTVGG
jgi:PmbA protein